MTTRNHRVRFMTNNFFNADMTITVSSEASGFPKANLYHQHRSKLFKFNGNFTVDSTRNAIHINDGSVKVAYVPSGSYTATALATAATTALNAISSGWTVSYTSATKIFKIARSSGSVLFSTTTNAIWTTLGYTDTSDRTVTTGGLPAQQIRVHNEEWIKCDTGLALPLGFVAAIGLLGQPMSFSPSATFRFQANNIDVWTAPPLDVTVTNHERGIMRFMDDPDDYTYRYSRLLINDATNPDGPNFAIGHYYVGDYETFTTTNIAPGFRPKRVDQSSVFESEAGVKWSRLKKSYREWTDLQVDLALAADRRRFQSLYETVGLTTPFFASLDPTLVVSTELQELTGYVYFAQDIALEHQVRDYMRLMMDLREAI